MSSTAALKEKLFSAANNLGIKDPLSGAPLLSERALTGLLCFHSQRGNVDWNSVPLYDVSSVEETDRCASSLITSNGSFLSEYVLLHQNSTEESIWGEMPADIIYMDNPLTTAVMFENKIGSKIGYEHTAEKNQLARQLEFLITLRNNSRVSHAALLLISGREMLKKGWYREEFKGALDYKKRGVTVDGFLVMWEDVFQAINLNAS